MLLTANIQNEFRAGLPFPLVDQAVTGFSGGTFDVEIIDQFEKDELEFKSRFPALRDVNIQKAILPPFDRTKAQKWWEANSRELCLRLHPFHKIGATPMVSITRSSRLFRLSMADENDFWFYDSASNFSRSKARPL